MDSKHSLKDSNTGRLAIIQTLGQDGLVKEHSVMKSQIFGFAIQLIQLG